MSYSIHTDKLTHPEVGHQNPEAHINLDIVRKLEIKPILIPILLLFLTLSPGVGGAGITISKAITGGLIFLLTFPAIVASCLNMNKTKGRLVLLGFLLISVLNIFVALANHLSIGYWLRLAFGSYVFAATTLTVSYYANTANRRHNLWVWLVILLTLASLSEWLFAARFSGIEEVIDSRGVGGKAGPLVAAMTLLPAFGNLLLKSVWLSMGFYSNVLLLMLSGSRTNYILLVVGILYSILFIRHKFSTRLLYIVILIAVGLIMVSSAAFEKVTYRFSIINKDESTLARLDQANSAIATVMRDNFVTVLFGKGFGAPYKVNYRLTRAAGVTKFDETQLMPPHNDYAARFLYCGLIGLASEILLFLIIGYVFYTAIRKLATDNIDLYAQVRMHGAMLVLMCTVIFGFGGGIFYLWNNNIFQGCILGIGLTEATAILSRDYALPAMPSRDSLTT
jgi:O-antigen ligase